MSEKTSGGQPGNENAREGRRVKEAIKRALARSGGTIESGLDRIASKVVEKATEGLPWAVEFIADRVDGRATQHISATVEHNVNVGSSESLTQPLSRALEVRTKSTVQ